VLEVALLVGGVYGFVYEVSRILVARVDPTVLGLATYVTNPLTECQTLFRQSWTCEVMVAVIGE